MINLKREANRTATALIDASWHEEYVTHSEVVDLLEKLQDFPIKIETKPVGEYSGNPCYNRSKIKVELSRKILCELDELLEFDKEKFLDEYDHSYEDKQ
jgi:hypothetical protein